MRRILVVLLLSLLPFQFVWGAAAGYCLHEQGAGVKHFGHHAHKHQSKGLKVAGESTADKKNVTCDDDPDCPGCHLTCVSPVMGAAALFSPEPGASPRAAPSNEQPAYIPSAIERPNWTLAA